MKFKKMLRDFLPHKHHVQGDKQYRFVSQLLHDPNIFHLTRRSVAGGTAVGLFFAFVPVPGQTLIAMLVSIWFRVNLPLAGALTWISNPFTSPAIFYLSYKLGATILGHPYHPVDFEMTWAWFTGTLMNIWPALLAGCLIFAVTAAVASYFIVIWLWRLAVIQKWEKRKSDRSLRDQS